GGVGAGLAYGWWRRHDMAVQAQVEPPHNSRAPHPREEVRPVAGPGREEQRLLDAIKELKAHPEPYLTLAYHLDLGLLYLKEWRLDDAEKVFKELEDAPEKGKFSSRPYGVLGRAMVLAFRDQPQESNALFRQVLVQKGVKGIPPPPVNPYLLKRPALAEMVAKALDHNFANTPPTATFPRSLQMYRVPPRPPEKKEI